jgi:hypothetical protein
VKRAGMAILLLVAAAAIGGACGGGNGGGTNSTATSTASFEQLRDALRNRLTGVGVNIGSVPDDVLTQILNQCHGLDKLADQNRVNDLCDAIRRARDTNDVGLVDQIVTQLGQLLPK